MYTIRNQTRFAKLAVSPTMLAMPLAVLLLFVLVAATTNAQAPYRVGGSPSMTLYGTSTLHDWTMTTHSFTANGEFTISPDNQLASLNSLTVVLPVKNLKSEHSGMDDNAYDALHADKNKDITFKLTSADITPQGGNKYGIAAHGNLSIAGATKPVTLNANGVLNADQSLSVSGSVALTLSQFNIERPSFMLGTMKVGDVLKLNYSLIFVK
jgi:polyisoprenoid-binding protein YceI